MIKYCERFFVHLARGMEYKLDGELRYVENTAWAYIAFCFLFGINPASMIYCIAEMHKKKITPTHLLWALSHAKIYNTEKLMASKLDVSHKTFRKRLFQAMQAITAVLPKVESISEQFVFTML